MHGDVCCYLLFSLALSEFLVLSTEGKKKEEEDEREGGKGLRPLLTFFSSYLWRPLVQPWSWDLWVALWGEHVPYNHRER